MSQAYREFMSMQADMLTQFAWQLGIEIRSGTRRDGTEYETNVSARTAAFATIDKYQQRSHTLVEHAKKEGEAELQERMRKLLGVPDAG